MGEVQEVAKQNTQKTKPWVKLHLAKQCDSCEMPPFIIGILQQELPGYFTLSNVIELVPDPEAPSGFRAVERQFFDVINRTYVYRCEILGGRPDFDLVDQDEEYSVGGRFGSFGGLGE